MSNRNTTNITGRKNEKHSIIIPAAGMGYRMRSYGPKPLIRINQEKTIVQNQIEIIKNNFVNPEIILVCGFEADRVMKNTPTDIIKIENENYEKTNVLRSIGMGLRAATSDRVLIVYGDLVFNNEAIKNLKLENSCIAIEQSYMSDEEVGCNISDGFVEQLLPDIPNKWAQIMFLMDKELDIFRKVSWDKNKSQYFGFEAINETIEKGGRFKSCTPNKAKITDVDSSKDLNMARKMLCS